MAAPAAPAPFQRRLRLVQAQLSPRRAAQRQQCLPTAPPPVTGATAGWRAALHAQQHQQPLLRPQALESIDRAQFLRDGYAVLPGAMTAAAAQRWRASSRRVQRLHDEFITGDWGSGGLWRGGGLGLPEPETPPPPACLRAAACGASQTLPKILAEYGQGWGKRAEVMRHHGWLPEYFPSGYDEFFMDVVHHPQMVELQHRLFGEGSYKLHLNHCHLLTRPVGYAGGNWHSHPQADGRDGMPPLAPYAYGRGALGIIFTFAYPDGFRGDDADGGLKVCPGSHLFRDPAHCRASSWRDAEFLEGWARGRRHPSTGQPLTIRHLVGIHMSLFMWLHN
jgi:hypothetical protein